MSDVTQADVALVRSIMADLLVAGAHGDKDAWRAVEAKIAAHRIAGIEQERERCARIADKESEGDADTPAPAIIAAICAAKGE